MAKFIAPEKGETRKRYIHRAYGIGKGEGRGRISAEGHERIAEAKAKGFTFSDEETVSAPKAPSVPKAPKATAKVVIPSEKRAEAGSVDPSEVRAWAMEKGLIKSTRGRIPAEVTLRYLNEVPAHERGEREQAGKDLRQGAPRVHPEGTTWRADFTNHRNEKETVILSDRTACGTCRYSLGWCGCSQPRVTVGYESSPIRLTTIPPKE